jgi:transcription elongation factor GreB
VKKNPTDQNDDTFDDDEDAESDGGGYKNYITPEGYERLCEELKQIKLIERPKVTELVAWAASLGDRSENADYLYGKKKLRELDRRIRFLTKRIEMAEVVEYTKNRSEQVFFGATVTILDEDGIQKIYHIVGADEMDADRGKISWVSPLAKALFKAVVGDFVEFETPSGVRELEIIAVSYEKIPI